MIFFYQQRGKEDEWRMALSTERAKVLAQQPAFTTVLDLSGIPEDNDWSKVRYRGPLYFDFDAGGDLERVCDEFRNFLAKLDVELKFDISQARFYASGSKGFHVEIPEEVFMPKVPPAGTPWLPYVYRAMAESLFVDTLDLNVYTGKRGRQWRTTNVVRENGCYKVPLSLEDALTITPEVYLELIKHPRIEPAPTPATTSPEFVVLFNRAKDKVVSMMRNKAKRTIKANSILDPWKKAGKTMPSIERLMEGRDIAENAGFQAIAMQLSIYAASVGMPQPEFLDRCKGLVEHHVSDGVRYNTPSKRREELSRMWQYMSENSLYDFEVDPIARLLKPGTDTSDLGQMPTDDQDDRKDQPQVAADEADKEDGDKTPSVEIDVHRRLRRGFFMNGSGMFRRQGDETDPICRATLRSVDAFYDVESNKFLGYEFDIYVAGRCKGRVMATSEVFTSAQKLRTFFAAYQISFQGSESDAASLMDIMAEKAERGGQVFVYPREGFFLVEHPVDRDQPPVKCYLSKDTFISSLSEDDPNYFDLKYQPNSVTSSYNVDIHWAPDIEPYMENSFRDLLSFNRRSVVANLLGWFTAAHYRSMYLHLFRQFPLLQAYGEAGSGKSQTVILLAHMHWYSGERVPIKNAMAFTPFALDAHATSSTSAPFLIDEYKPRELRATKGKAEKIKDLFKASYTGNDVGERGTVNKGAENSLALIKFKATAPIAFMGEAIEMETAILERCVLVGFSKKFHNSERKAAFGRLQADPTALSALGRQIMMMGFKVNLKRMREDMQNIMLDIESRLPPIEDEESRRMAPRMIFNRAVVIHGLTVLKHILSKHFDDRFDQQIDDLINAPDEDDTDRSTIEMHSMSEISKVMSRVALLSRDKDTAYEMVMGQDYMVGDGWVEVKVERAYDKYRLYCASTRDTPLFDTLEAFVHALRTYAPTMDQKCPSSALRQEGSTERIFRFNARKLLKEGVGQFRY